MYIPNANGFNEIINPNISHILYLLNKFIGNCSMRIISVFSFRSPSGYSVDLSGDPS